MTTTEWMVLVGGLGLAAVLIALFRAMLGAAYDDGFEDGYTTRICGRKHSSRGSDSGSPFVAQGYNVHVKGGAR